MQPSNEERLNMLEDKNDTMEERRGSNVSDSSESAYSSNGISPNLPNHHERKESVRSYRLRRKLRHRKQMQRLVSKDGVCNVAHKRVKNLGKRLIADIFTTLIDLRWRYNLSVFTLAYVLSWFLFGIVWVIIAVAHGDMYYQSRNITDPAWQPCVDNVDSFTSSFLFSVETQTTIGYGVRSVTEACPHAILVVVIQSVVSCLIDAVMIGCIFAKIARPKKRAATLKFSKNAVIAQRDGRFCFMFRVGDIRDSHLFEAHLRAYLIKPRVTAEGEIIPLHSFNMDLDFDTGEDRIFLVWPLIICHEIDEDSPLYEYSAKGLENADFEIVVILEGIVEQTGLTTQARTSYLPSEIMWGYRFASSVVFLKSENDKQYDIDYSKFDQIYHAPETPRLSPKENDMRKRRAASISESPMDPLDSLRDYILKVMREAKIDDADKDQDTDLRNRIYNKRLEALTSRDKTRFKSRSSEHLSVNRVKNAFPLVAAKSESIDKMTINTDDTAYRRNSGQNSSDGNVSPLSRESHV
ncbi:G protein-activated inward rectifier potassium channel 3-like [Acanthaster planci]|uniref:G protein-activated inward rectifier potassium channel 3 n=1 Tax=Acanthaster planci TaxID=133434 RepID=A0A8B7YJX1_ACAPL|nr:G protein-activated inward rectifier potassium channel 3-like [Acanthaster planci]XP_022092721.1 G protein-activated inward rectifier potassium channel 3-like [Acanthaster planci]